VVTTKRNCPATRISTAQIEDDLARLANVAGYVRTYSIDHGLDQIAGLAVKHGLKVIQGLWLKPCVPTVAKRPPNGPYWV